MAKAAAKARTKSRRKPPGKGRPAAKPPAATTGVALWWGGLGCGAATVLSPASAVLLAILLAPVLLVALLPEEGSGRRTVTAAALFGLAGSVHTLRQLWDAGATVSAAVALAHRPLVLLGAWTAVLAGWFACEVAGIMLRLTADLAAASKRRGYAAVLASLEEEWGPLPPVTGPG